MTYNLYIDVVFFINFVMDYLLLCILRIILKEKTTWLRMAAGSGAGALWACVVTVWPVLPRALEGLVTYTVISILMIKLSFQIKGAREVIKAVLGLYLSAVTLGGGIYALYQHTRAGYYVEQLIRGGGMDSASAAILLLCAAGVYTGLSGIWLVISEVRQRQSHIYSVTLSYQGRTETVSALLDTGNHLYEPVTHKPVHIVTAEVLEQLCEQVTAIIYIPYHAIGTEEGMLPGVFLDSMMVGQGEKKITITKPLVAISKQPLSPGGEYQMLLNEDL